MLVLVPTATHFAPAVIVTLTRQKMEDTYFKVLFHVPFLHTPKPDVRVLTTQQHQSIIQHQKKRKAKKRSRRCSERFSLSGVY